MFVQTAGKKDHSAGQAETPDAGGEHDTGQAQASSSRR